MSTSELPSDGFPGGFSVLMAVYGNDDPELFCHAVRSVLSNTLQPNRFVLVVDGPIPNALETIIAKYWQGESSSNVIRLPVNVGLAQALNAGLACIDTEWVVRADADDINLDRRFEHLAFAIRQAQESIDIIGSAIREVDKFGNGLAIRRPPLSHEDILRQMPRRNPLNHMSVAYRIAAVRAVGGYPNIHLKEDYALWCRLAHSRCRFLNLHAVLVHATTGIDMYRRRGGWRYIRSEVDIQRAMVRLNLKRRGTALLDGLMRSAVFALPNHIRGAIYRRLLRTRDES